MHIFCLNLKDSLLSLLVVAAMAMIRKREDATNVERMDIWPENAHQEVVVAEEAAVEEVVVCEYFLCPYFMLKVL